MKIRTSLAVVRAALDARAAGASYVEMGRLAGVECTTARKWVLFAATQPEGWPTPADIAAQAAEDKAKAQKRARNAARARSYAKRRYLAGGAPLMVSSLGTARRLQALAALGWTTIDLAPLLGVSPSRVGHMTTGMYGQVFRSTAARVAAVYDELSMQVPVDPEETQRYLVKVHERQRKMALAKGYAPPLAWDDDQLDDPKARPAVEWRPRPPTRVEVLEEIDDEAGTVVDACARLKVSRKALERWCLRHGLNELYSRLVARANPDRPGASEHLRTAS
ncbi:hypothetical protein P5P86_11890 [Nocardioides sp. BP30]|uniref:hypothetical protein n=1 Tax=Nocardioides sp. BP30 TaxID=3036374 RepID=UPI002469B9CA|nr:hypothetical protein [Nocardioides sp. BP30]WGL50665.1 hypothetical protein P5P86_11890 [Nocardioides sp. BP30]